MYKAHCKNQKKIRNKGELYDSRPIIQGTEEGATMANNQINFSKITKEAMSLVKTFKETALRMAEEDIRYKAEIKPLKIKLEKILADRQNDLDQGLDPDEVAQKYPRLEVDNALRRAELRHKEVVEPLNKALRDTYVFIPEGLYEAYCLKIREGKRGDFLNCIKQFLESLGIEGCRQGQVSKFAESMSDKLGAKYASSKKIVNDGVFVVAMNKNGFNKLFMAIFCDTFVK
mgnify:CR=1 FL=1